MKIKKLAQYIFAPLLAATILLSADSVLAQVAPQEPITLTNGPVRPSPCPVPVNRTLIATSPLNVFSGDFSTGQNNHPTQAGLNDSGTNKMFRYTLQWRSENRCCQITKAVLTVRMRANQSGSPGGADASNDGITVMYNTNVVAGHNSPVYGSTSFPINTPAVKTWTLNAAALININASNRLSFAVQDDTRVISANLQLWGCCLGTPREP